MDMNTLLLVGATLAACYTDLRWKKIPNALVAPFLILGAGFQLAHGPQALVAALAAGAAMLLLGTLAFSTRMMGGGDVKFLVAAIVALGAADGLRFLVFTLVCGGVLAIAVSLYRGSLRTMFANVRASAMTLSAPVSTGKMPYALAMLGAAVLLVAAQTILPVLRFPL